MSLRRGRRIRGLKVRQCRLLRRLGVETNDPPNSGVRPVAFEPLEAGRCYVIFFLVGIAGIRCYLRRLILYPIGRIVGNRFALVVSVGLIVGHCLKR